MCGIPDGVNRQSATTSKDDRISGAAFAREICKIPQKISERLQDIHTVSVQNPFKVFRTSPPADRINRGHPAPVLSIFTE
jgi:hypothetical protein